MNGLGGVASMLDGSFRARVQQKVLGKKSYIYGPRRALRPDAEVDLAAIRFAAEGKASREEGLAAMAAEAERLKDERASEHAARQLEARQEVEETLRRLAEECRREDADEQYDALDYEAIQRGDYSGLGLSCSKLTDVRPSVPVDSEDATEKLRVFQSRRCLPGDLEMLLRHRADPNYLPAEGRITALQEAL